MKSYYSFSLAFLYLFFFFFFLSVCSTTNSDFVNQACKDAANKDPNINYGFCVSCLEENVKSQKASSIEELFLIMMDMTITNATNVRSLISKLLTDEKLDNFTRRCLKTCSGLYSDAVSDLQDARRAFESKDYATASTYMSAALDAPSTCEDSFKEGGHHSPLAPEDSIFFQMTAIPLAFLTMINSRH